MHMILVMVDHSISISMIQLISPNSYSNHKQNSCGRDCNGAENKQCFFLSEFPFLWKLFVSYRTLIVSIVILPDKSH